jgi:hypothetical protein
MPGPQDGASSAPAPGAPASTAGEPCDTIVPARRRGELAASLGGEHRGADTLLIARAATGSKRAVAPAVADLAPRRCPAWNDARQTGDFIGRGDMSRGGLLLRAARAGSELPYPPVQGTPRRGARAPRLPPRNRRPG